MEIEEAEKLRKDTIKKDNEEIMKKELTDELWTPVVEDMKGKSFLLSLMFIQQRRWNMLERN